MCLGHQIIGQTFGSKIIQADKLMHGKTSKVRHKNIGIFRGLKRIIYGTRYHSLIVERKSSRKRFNNYCRN